MVQALLCVRSVDEGQDLGDDCIQFRRDCFADIESGEDLDQIGVLLDIDTVRLGERNDLLSNLPAA